MNGLNGGITFLALFLAVMPLIGLAASFAWGLPTTHAHHENGQSHEF